jgi:hypothetical protein
MTVVSPFGETDETDKQRLKPDGRAPLCGGEANSSSDCRRSREPPQTCCRAVDLESRDQAVNNSPLRGLLSVTKMGACR